MAVVVLALGASACSSYDGVFGTSRPQPSTSRTSSSFSDRMNSLFFGAPAQSGDVDSGPKADLDCPTIDVRQGASTISIGTAGGEAAGNLRYQISIARTARECSLAAGTMTIKTGVQGRIILGPAGVAGQVDVPLRLALVQEGVSPKTVWTKFYRVPVTVPPGQTNVPWAPTRWSARRARPSR